MKAIHFNPIDDGIEFREIETEFKVYDEFYFRTDKGPLLRGEVWKDTPKNRGIIQQIINKKIERRHHYNEMTQQLYKLVNEREY